MQVLSTLALVGISTLLSTPVDARHGPFRVRPMNVTIAASGATAASMTAPATAVHLHSTVIPTGGLVARHNATGRYLPYNNTATATITVSHKPTATPFTPYKYDHADHPRNPGYVCRKEYRNCYERAPQPPDSDYIKAIEANDQESLDAHEKESILASENDDVCHAVFKTCLGFAPEPVVPDSKDDKVINPRQRKGQEKHTLPQQEQEQHNELVSEEVHIAQDFNHKPIPVDDPSVHEVTAVAQDQPIGFGLGPILPRSDEGLESRPYLTEEEQKEHYKSFRLGKIPVRSGPMGVGPILPRDNTLAAEPIHPGQIHDKPTLETRDNVRTTESQFPPQGPNSGHAQGDPWRTANTLDKRFGEPVPGAAAPAGEPVGDEWNQYVDSVLPRCRSEGICTVMKRDLTEPKRMTPEAAAKQDPRGAAIAKQMYHPNEPRDLNSNGKDAGGDDSTPDLSGVDYVASAADYKLKADAAKYGSINDGFEHESTKELDKKPVSVEDLILLRKWPPADVSKPSPLPSRRLRRSSYGSTDHESVATPLKSQPTEPSFQVDIPPIEIEITTARFPKPDNSTVTASQNSYPPPSSFTFPGPATNSTNSTLTTLTTPLTHPTSHPILPLTKRQSKFLPNAKPPMWEDHMHGPFDVEDVTFGEGGMVPRPHKRSAIPAASGDSKLIPRDDGSSDPDDEFIGEEEWKDDVKALEGKGKGKRELPESTWRLISGDVEKGDVEKRAVPEETRRLMSGDVHKLAEWEEEVR